MSKRSQNQVQDVNQPVPPMKMIQRSILKRQEASQNLFQSLQNDLEKDVGLHNTQSTDQNLSEKTETTLENQTTTVGRQELTSTNFFSNSMNQENPVEHKLNSSINTNEKSVTPVSNFFATFSCDEKYANTLRYVAPRGTKAPKKVIPKDQQSYKVGQVTNTNNVNCQKIYRCMIYYDGNNKEQIVPGTYTILSVDPQEFIQTKCEWVEGNSKSIQHLGRPFGFYKEIESDKMLSGTFRWMDE